MSLRSRLLLAASLSVLVLVGVLAGVAFRQHSVLTDQLDDQLESLAARFENFPTSRDDRVLGDPNRAGPPPTGEIYGAIVQGTETLIFAEPASQPDLRVSLTSSELAELATTGEPFTVDVTGADGEARAIAVQIDDDTWLLSAISTSAIEDAQRQLLITGAGAVAILGGALGLVIWWVDRLGIRPIIEVTRAAEDVAAGRTERRVDHPSQTTEAGRLGAAFNTMLDERQSSEEKQRRFVADASHELRTPLTTLHGYAALYESGGLTKPDQVADAMRRIKDEASRMERLVDDLLILAALDDEQPLEIERLDLTQLLTDIAADARAIQPNRLVSTDSIEPDLYISADTHQLTKALTTIVSNVLRHTAADADLSFRATLSRTDFSRAAFSRTDLSRTASNEGTIRIEISDTGAGIEPEHLARLFDRFYRVEAARSRAKGGSGLGLSIAKAIIESHQGTINIKSSTMKSSAGASQGNGSASSVSPGSGPLSNTATGTTIIIVLPTTHL